MDRTVDRSIVSSSSKSHHNVGVDVGGTFTDSVIVGTEGLLATGKALSTPDNFSEGVVNSVTSAADNLGITLARLLEDCDYFCHATTVAENALLTRTGVKAGLITTYGFEDTLLIMRGKGRIAGLGEAAILHPVKTDKPAPLIPRPLIEGVLERVDYKGKILIPLSKAETAKAVSNLVSKDVDAIAVCLLWSFMQPKHEELIKEYIQQNHPDIFVTISSELAPMMGEYERTATTAINAYLGPITARYLKSLIAKLLGHGFKGNLLIMQAYGGLVPVERAVENSVALIESGPVAGVTGSMQLASKIGLSNVIAADMGGTTFKVGIIADRVVQYAVEPVIAQYNILTPRMDVSSIGAGGGSIAWIDPVTRSLRVGPRSAGAQPGPVCYDMGGDEPTVTDADLLLGYLNPKYFLGGSMILNKEKTIAAIEKKLCPYLSMNPQEAAESVYRITNAQMADLIHKVTVEKGHDPREFALFSYGGASPVHCCSYARELGIQKIVIPATASVHCAFGVVISDVVREYALSDRLTVPADPKKVSRTFRKLQNQAYSDLRNEGFKTGQIALNRFLEIRYRRQVHQIPTPLPLVTNLTSKDMELVYAKFEDLYENAYGKGTAFREAGMEIVNFRLRAVGAARKVTSKEAAVEGRDARGALVDKRQIFSPIDEDYLSAPIYRYERLKPGNRVEGPAVIETSVTTIVVDADRVAQMDQLRNIVLELRR